MDEDEDGDESDEEIVLNSTSMIPDFLSAEATASKEGPEDECAMEMSSSPAGKIFPFTSSINAFFLPILSISEEGRFGKDVSVSSGGRPVVLVYRSATCSGEGCSAKLMGLPAGRMIAA